MNNKKQTRGILMVVGILLLLPAFTLKRAVAQTNAEKPKIVIGMMVDQMRWDYLYKYRDRYGKGGFNRLLREGFSCENTFIRHVPTVTACGHASVFTGSVPAVNGIVGNHWYDRSMGRYVSNVEDRTVELVGVHSDEGRSPRNLLTTTIGDELRISNNYQSKVVGVSIKDRGAILPAGHAANGAFWYEDGKFITSTYYMEKLPGWVTQFNKKNWEKILMPDGWHTLYPIESYQLSTTDNKYYENIYDGEKAPVFPHKKASLSSSAFGNTLTLEFAKAAIEGYQLGKDEYTDLLTVSLSSTDKVGHRFGPNSIEIEDTYLRLDKQLEQFFTYLDNRFGKNGYLFFLTADHGANHSPGYLKEHQLPVGIIDENQIFESLEKSLIEKYGVTDIVLTETNENIYLNYKVLKEHDLSKSGVIAFITEELKMQEGIRNAVSAHKLSGTTMPQRIKNMYINGHHPTRSGDIVLIIDSGWEFEDWMGASHSDWNPFDAHIPLVWMGWHIPDGESHRNIGMTDIAPTLAALLDIQMPSGNIGYVITEITDR